MRRVILHIGVVKTATTSLQENIFNQLYSDFKLSKGIVSSDVLKKAQSLRSTHTLNTTADDLKFFKKTGFKKIDIFFKYLNFTGFLLEK